MRIYKIKPQSKLLINFASSLFVILGILMIILLRFDTEASLKHWVASIGIVVFGILGILTFNKIEVIIEREKIEVHHPLRKFNPLFWNEIKEMTGFYFLFPEAGGVTLIPKTHLGKKPIHVSIWGMPIELVKDILSHLPPDTKVYLYPYLKRKVEGKQTWFYIK